MTPFTVMFTAEVGSAVPDMAAEALAVGVGSVVVRVVVAKDCVHTCEDIAVLAPHAQPGQTANIRAREAALLAATDIAPTPPRQEGKQADGRQHSHDDQESIGRQHESPPGGKFFGAVKIFHRTTDPK